MYMQVTRVFCAVFVAKQELDTHPALCYFLSCIPATGGHLSFPCMRLCICNKL